MRLIDADELQKMFNETTSSLINKIDHKDIEHFVRACIMTTEMIKDAPTIDAEPVRHGHWEIAIGYDPRKAFQCSECRKMAFENTQYCPNCGAKMEVNGK